MATTGRYDYNGGQPGPTMAMSSGQPGPIPPVYQIDFAAVAAGKRIKSTKRRVRW